MKPLPLILLLFTLLTFSTAAAPPDDALTQLKQADHCLDLAMDRMDVRSVLQQDKRFALILSHARTLTPTLPLPEQYTFEQNLSMLAEFHIQRMEFISNAFVRLAENQAQFARQEDFLQELRAVNQALRCYRYPRYPRYRYTH